MRRLFTKEMRVPNILQSIEKLALVLRKGRRYFYLRNIRENLLMEKKELKPSSFIYGDSWGGTRGGRGGEEWYPRAAVFVMMSYPRVCSVRYLAKATRLRERCAPRSCRRTDSDWRCKITKKETGKNIFLSFCGVLGMCKASALLCLRSTLLCVVELLIYNCVCSNIITSLISEIQNDEHGYVETNRVRIEMGSICSCFSRACCRRAASWLKSAQNKIQKPR